MAEIAAVSSHLKLNSRQILWETLTESDTAQPWAPHGREGANGSIQVVGTFGGATVVLQQSNDGTTWATAKNTFGSDISFTAAGMAEFSNSAKYLRASASGGSSQDVDVYMILRGQD